MEDREIMRLYCGNCTLCKCYCNEKDFFKNYHQCLSTCNKQWRDHSNTYKNYEVKDSYNDDINPNIMNNLENLPNYASSKNYENNVKYLFPRLHNSCPQLNRHQVQYSSLPRNFTYNGLRQPLTSPMHYKYCIHNNIQKARTDQLTKTLVLCKRCAA